ncbi:MAG: class I SAM-dependent methyltransferase, partial [Myxococcota bacterium]
DRNRRTQSDPVLWRLLGDVTGLRVLDAGCGTGYLAAKLAAAGAGSVVGVDLSANMIAVARREVGAGVTFRVDDAQTLATVPDASVDRVISNHVWMDLPDAEAAVRATARVLAPGGFAVVVFLHPDSHCGRRHSQPSNGFW